MADIVARGQRAYLDDEILQEAGDSLMMKLGEAANRLTRLEVLAPEGVDWALAVANRNFIIHQYDEINRELTWLTLARDLPKWRDSLAPHFTEAQKMIDSGR
ncbi:MAG: HepT-like ribonuclease domain-containing protein [Candidatus Nanopelagicales bacterium]